MKTLIAKKDLPREDWLKIRKTGIGGSDVAAICGINPWKSPFQVWLEKTGQVEEEDLSSNEAVQWGNKLEDLIAEEFTARTGLKVRRVNFILQDPEYPFMLGNIDRRIEGKDEGLEIKTTNARNESWWKGEEVPDFYYLQVQHYLAITGWQKWHIAVLIGGQKLLIKEVLRNEEIIKSLIEKEKAFWQLVETKTAPPVDGSESSGEALILLNPQSNGQTIELPEEAEGWIRIFFQVSEQIKLDEARKQEAKNKLIEMLGENEAGWAGTALVIWKSTKIRQLLDTQKFKKEQPSVYAQYLKDGEPSRKFSIKIKGEEGEINGTGNG